MKNGAEPKDIVCLRGRPLQKKTDISRIRD